MATKKQKTFRVLGIRSCTIEVLKPRFLRVMWDVIGGTPPENQLTILDDDVLYIGKAPTGMNIQINAYKEPYGFIALWVHNIEALRAHLTSRGIEVYDGIRAAGQRYPGFNIAKATFGCDVDVRIDEAPKKLKQFFFHRRK